MVFLQFLLWPFSWLYGSVMLIRNKAFDWGWFEQKKVDVHVISVGNLSTGGTGKSPFVQWLAQILPEKQTGILSRGYKRQSKGFLWVESTSTATDVGDEPLMHKLKLPHTAVAVCEKRVIGAQRMVNENPRLRYLVLDDAFQHRHIKRDLNIMLSRFDRPFFNDWVLPSGQLREFKSGCKRAHVVIFTHCEPHISQAQIDFYRQKTLPFCVEVLFGRTQTGPLLDRHGNAVSNEPKKALLLAGMAQPYRFRKTIETQFPNMVVVCKFFADHHLYSEMDFQKMLEESLEFCSGQIITTQKDWARIPQKWKQHPQLNWGILPLSFGFLFDGEKTMRKLLEKHTNLPL